MAECNLLLSSSLMPKKDGSTWTHLTDRPRWAQSFYRLCCGLLRWNFRLGCASENFRSFAALFALSRCHLEIKMAGRESKHNPTSRQNRLAAQSVLIARSQTRLSLRAGSYCLSGSSMDLPAHLFTNSHPVDLLTTRTTHPRSLRHFDLSSRPICHIRLFRLVVQFGHRARAHYYRCMISMPVGSRVNHPFGLPSFWEDVPSFVAFC